MHLPLVDLHRSGFSVGVVAKAAPDPKVGLAHQSTLHRIAMHVAQLFNTLAFAPYVEVVEALLPDVGIWFTVRCPKRRLLGKMARPPPDFPGETLLEHLHHCGRRTLFPVR